MDSQSRIAGPESTWVWNFVSFARFSFTALVMSITELFLVGMCLRVLRKLLSVHISMIKCRYENG